MSSWKYTFPNYESGNIADDDLSKILNDMKQEFLLVFWKKFIENRFNLDETMKTPIVKRDHIEMMCRAQNITVTIFAKHSQNIRATLVNVDNKGNALDPQIQMYLFNRLVLLPGLLAAAAYAIRTARASRHNTKLY